MKVPAASRIILGVESSCDETAVALVQGGNRVLSSQVYSQVATHARFGGVVPEIASREHLVRIHELTQLAFQEADIGWSDIDAIAVTQGPGLIGSLLVGASFARGLALAKNLPIIPVDHIHAHIYGAFLGLKEEELASLAFPLLALVVSGGHTNLYLMEEALSFRLIGYSKDDACGESFDKVAKLFKLGYPGGPWIERTALTGDPRAFSMPNMMSQDPNSLLFSYSGLKTHMVQLAKKLGDSVDADTLANLCASFQQAAFEQVTRKVAKALEQYPARALIVAGGVAANATLRRLLARDLSLPVFLPALKYCGDNAAMIAALGDVMYRKNPALYAGPGRFDWQAYSKYNQKMPLST